MESNIKLIILMLNLLLLTSNLKQNKDKSLVWRNNIQLKDEKSRFQRIGMGDPIDCIQEHSQIK